MTSPRPVQLVKKAPTLLELVDLAFSHDRKGLMEGLARRYDALGQAKHLEAVSSFNFLTENPKKTVQEAKWAGQTTAGEQTETPETLVTILWEICNGND